MITTKQSLLRRVSDHSWTFNTFELSEFDVEKTIRKEAHARSVLICDLSMSVIPSVRRFGERVISWCEIVGDMAADAELRSDLVDFANSIGAEIVLPERVWVTS